jgi:hypothetical protein
MDLDRHVRERGERVETLPLLVPVLPIITAFTWVLFFHVNASCIHRPSVISHVNLYDRLLIEHDAKVSHHVPREHCGQVVRLLLREV